MKKINKNKIIDQIIFETMSKYIQESTKVIAEQICDKCPLKNEQCQLGPCSSAASLIMEHANRQITEIAMMN